MTQIAIVLALHQTEVYTESNPIRHFDTQLVMNTRILIVREHNVESHRAHGLTLLKPKRRILTAQAPTNRDRSNTRGNPTRSRIDDITIPRLHHRWWIRRTRSRTRLFRVRRLARHSTSVDIVARERELATTEEYEVAWCLQVVGKIKDEVADFALCGV